MKRCLMFFVFCFSIFSFQYSIAQQVRVIKFNTLDSLLKLDNDTTYVINFWATWCKPCVQELPCFEELKENYSKKKLKVIYVSLDFKKDLHSRVEYFLEKNGIKFHVLLLDELNYNNWIDQVDKSWSGAIPATAIHRGKIKKFYEQEFTSYFELEKALKQFRIE